MSYTRLLVVYQQGALDAIYSEADMATSVSQMFKEIERVLTTDGCYCCISLCQEHIIELYLRSWSHCDVTIERYGGANLSSVNLPDSKLTPFLLMAKKTAKKSGSIYLAWSKRMVDREGMCKSDPQRLSVHFCSCSSKATPRMNLSRCKLASA